jgi:branched-chain amino acid transport system ATP-binding protein
VLPDSPALEVRDIVVRFGGVTAVDHASFQVAAGRIVGLVGPNGAGKTTILDAISGFVPCEGSVLLAGQDLSLFSAHERGRVGLGRSFQDGRLFPSLTVQETLTVALERHSDRVGAFNACMRLGPSRRSERELARRVDALIDTHGLGRYRNAFISELSTGTRRIVDIACTVAHGPTVLLLDEPSSGIAQREAEALVPMLLQIRADLDCSIVIIEHDMPLIRAVSDELIALETGRVIAQGDPDDVLHDPRVVQSYLGDQQDVIERSGSTRKKPRATRAVERAG